MNGHNLIDECINCIASSRLDSNLILYLSIFIYAMLLLREKECETLKDPFKENPTKDEEREEETEKVKRDAQGLKRGDD